MEAKRRQRLSTKNWQWQHFGWIRVYVSPVLIKRAKRPIQKVCKLPLSHSPIPTTFPHSSWSAALIEVIALSPSALSVSIYIWIAISICPSLSHSFIWLLSLVRPQNAFVALFITLTTRCCCCCCCCRFCCLGHNEHGQQVLSCAVSQKCHCWQCIII